MQHDVERGLVRSRHNNRRLGRVQPFHWILQSVINDPKVQQVNLRPQLRGAATITQSTPPQPKIEWFHEAQEDEACGNPVWVWGRQWKSRAGRVLVNIHSSCYLFQCDWTNELCSSVRSYNRTEISQEDARKRKKAISLCGKTCKF